jgi:hypothetical protein
MLYEKMEVGPPEPSCRRRLQTPTVLHTSPLRAIASLRRALQQYLRITMKSGTIRGRKIAYCFLFRRRQEGKREQCSAGNDWAAC